MLKNVPSKDELPSIGEIIPMKDKDFIIESFSDSFVYFRNIKTHRKFCLTWEDFNIVKINNEDFYEEMFTRTYRYRVKNV